MLTQEQLQYWQILWIMWMLSQQAAQLVVTFQRAQEQYVPEAPSNSLAGIQFIPLQ